MDSTTAAIWTLFGLEVSSPRLTLRYLTDDLGAQLADLAAQGIHDPAAMPFSEPWTDVPPPELQRNSLRYFWRCRAETTTENWHLTFAAIADGDVVGMCGLTAERFPATRTATTGSWLGLVHQGKGLGREMRQLALHLVFEGLGGRCARTRAWHDNIASLRVTRSLPYAEDGSSQEMRRDRDDTMLSFAMTRSQWKTVRRKDIELRGVRPAREFLGVS